VLSQGQRLEPEDPVLDQTITRSKTMKSIHSLFIALALALSLSTAALAQDPSVDINTATAEQLAEALVGIGASKAEAIVAYRDAHGEFEHIDELINVRGIGMRTVDRNRDRITLGEVESETTED
jgi:competence protein ComEA